MSNSGASSYKEISITNESVNGVSVPQFKNIDLNIHSKSDTYSRTALQTPAQQLFLLDVKNPMSWSRSQGH
jgi:hypothetical protein